MINGSVSEFVDHIHYGDELVFLFRNQKFFLQGFLEEDGRYALYLDRWDPPSNTYIWTGRGDTHGYPVDDFLAAAIWDGKSFWDVEAEIEWVDD